MRLTTKGRYAVTAMLDLALHRQNSPVSLTEISERQSISHSYLEQLFSKLRREKLVKSIRGPGGGYQLVGSCDDISVATIISAVNETTDVTLCESQANCHDGNQCLTHNLWVNLSQRIHSFLDDVSIGQLIANDQRYGKDKEYTPLSKGSSDTYRIELTPLK